MSENRKRTYGQVLEGLSEVVATKAADYVYIPPSGMNGTCSYWDRNNDCPSCMIGVYLHTIGYEAQVLQNMDDETDPAWSDDPGNLHQYFTDKANDLMKHVQFRQDTGDTWVQALERAQRTVENPPIAGSWRHYDDNEERI